MDVTGGGPASTSVRAGLDALVRRFGPFELDGGEPPAEPVFLLAAGWRSGSTLVQRLLVSGGSLLVWGEPYDHSATIRRMAETVAPFDDRWPPDRAIVRSADDMGAGQWLANRYPPPADFVAAHRAFHDRLFAEPARAAGFDRWGIKTVRLGGEHAAYLRALYPGARIVLLVRNPYDAFLSYRLLHDVRSSSYWWYYRWPDLQVSTARQFGLVWQHQVRSFCESAHELGALLVSFESIAGGGAVDELARFVGVAVDTSVLEARVGSSSAQRVAPTAEQARLSVDETWELQEAVDPVAADLGYTGPTAAATW